MKKLKTEQNDTSSLPADIFHSAFDSIILLNHRGQISEVNKATLQLLGGQPEDYFGRGIETLVAEIHDQEEDLFEFVSLDELILRGLIRNHRLHYVTKKGTRIPVLFSASLILRDGKLSGVLCIAKDLTEMVQAEQKLEEERRESEKKLRDMRDYAENIIRQVSDMLLVLDHEGRINRFNNNALRVLGYEELELTERYMGDLLVEPPTAGNPFRDIKTLEKVVAESGLQEMNGFFRAKSGEAIPVSVSASLFYNNDQLAGVILSAKDGRDSRLIQELRLKQQQLVQSAKLASLGELSGGIAHELNNPLSIITGYTEYIAENLNRNKELPGDQLKSYLEKMRHAADKMARIIQHIREFSRQTEKSRHLLTLREVVEKAFMLVRQQLVAWGIDIRFDWSGEKGMVLGDPSQLEQVFIALVTNARDAILEKDINPGRIHVNIEVRREFLCVHIEDNGIGISVENIGRIFDPFFTTKEVGKGTGLGLSIAHGIITDHGGEILVQSEAGRGSRFTVALPIAQG